MMYTPLAERMRPTRLDDYIGQQHLIGADGVLFKNIANGYIPSIILWGTPGIGKTTLAHIIAQELERPFYALSAINSGVKDVREIIDKAKEQPGIFTTQNPIVFIDEIHRFNKSQQDSLLHSVEKGWITLIGATTENPSFEVIPALLSRCQVYTLNEFSRENLEELLNRAIQQDKKLSQKNIVLKQTAALLAISSGDARKLLNTLEIVVESQGEQEQIIVDDKVVGSCLQKNTARYDKSGEQHYDIISAFIKSIRGSDPNAAVYWLARMIEGGEDVKFIARRLVIVASEEIGNANPTALVIANNTFQAVNTVGHPEARIILSQCTIYLATSVKSNHCYMAINKAQQLVRQTGDLPVPIHLRNAPTQLMKDLNYGKDYQYPHDYPQHFVRQEYMPDDIVGTKLYQPSGQSPRENQLLEHIRNLWGDKY